MKLIEMIKKQNNINLNNEQIEIINHLNGAGLVIATAGSGKSTTACIRVGKLIKDDHIDPEKIAVLSYSNESVNDIKNKFDYMLHKKIHMNERAKVNFSTIHKFAGAIIKYYYYKTNQVNINYLTDEEGKYNRRKLLKSIYYEINGEDLTLSQMDSLIKAISYINNNKTKSSVNLSEFNIPNNLTIIYNKYEEIKLRDNLIDYDDMIVRCYELLKNNVALRKYYGSKYEHVVIDEAQDMSAIQYEIFKMLFSKHTKSLLFIADDDQSIYSFRGSNPEILFDMNKNFTAMKQYYLNTNYRSSNTIVEVSKMFIEKNENRFDKEIKAYSDMEKDITIKKFRDSVKQCEFIAQEIKNNYMTELNDTAILFKNNISSVLITYFLRKKGIPFYVRNNDLNFFRHFVKDDIIAFILLADDKTLIKALNQIYSKIRMPFGKSDIKKIHDAKYEKESVFEAFKKLRGFSHEQRNSMIELERMLDELNKLRPSEAIEYVLQRIGYSDYLETLPQRIEYKNSIYEKHIELIKFFALNEPSIRTYWYKIGKLQQTINESTENNRKGAVTLTTIHSSKGLEFKNIFIIDLNNGIIPTMSSLNDIKVYDEFSEERRLMYVALTRAKENLYLLYVNKKSQFVEDIEEIINSRKDV